MRMVGFYQVQRVLQRRPGNSLNQISLIEFCTGDLALQTYYKTYSGNITFPTVLVDFLIYVE
jgi:hypothetical protein